MRPSKILRSSLYFIFYSLKVAAWSITTFVIIVCRLDGVRESGISFIYYNVFSKMGYKDVGASVAMYSAFMEVFMKGYWLAT